jgi:hypothetical protein
MKYQYYIRVAYEQAWTYSDNSLAAAGLGPLLQEKGTIICCHYRHRIFHSGLVY